MIFADTSALYAVLVENDRSHAAVRPVWTAYLRKKQRWVTTSYVLHETVALLQARAGMSAVRTWRNEVEPVLATVWVAASLHSRALASLVGAGRRDVSLTDWVSFEVMREMGIAAAFTLDRHFAEQGFRVVPSGGSPDV